MPKSGALGRIGANGGGCDGAFDRIGWSGCGNDVGGAASVGCIAGLGAAIVCANAGDAEACAGTCGTPLSMNSVAALAAATGGGCDDGFARGMTCALGRSGGAGGGI